MSVAPIFATKWLIPRLEGFRAAHPDIDVRLSATLELADFERDGIDAAIRCGRGRYPGLVAHRLFGESVVPMCSPALLKGEHALASPEELRHHVLLHFDWPAQEQVTPDWSTWLRSTEVKGIDATRGPRFTQPDYAMQAAMEGAGVVLGWRSLAQADIDSGRLVIPFDLPLQMDVAFYLSIPRPRNGRSSRFRECCWELPLRSQSVMRPTSPPPRDQHGGNRQPFVARSSAIATSTTRPGIDSRRKRDARRARRRGVRRDAGAAAG
jgi:LysR family glycine cleavage system transcriptional activator